MDAAAVVRVGAADPLTPFRRTHAPGAVPAHVGHHGRSKTVPRTTAELCVGARAIARSLALSPADCCLNFMPLHHIGGIVCNLLAPLCSGSAVVCVAQFAPDAVLAALAAPSPAITWVYAVPSHFQAILAVARDAPRHQLRLVRSGAAALPLAVAAQRRATLKTCVMPTNSMTECMPVGSTPLGYALEKPGSVGPSLGPELRVDASTGEVRIRGPLVMRGYVPDARAAEAEFAPAIDPDGWLATGDLGRLDDDGWLYLTGRSKEVINRGGEIVAPLEVEDVALAPPAVAECVCFAMPHAVLGEEVALALVPAPRVPAPTLSELRALRATLGEEAPVRVVHMRRSSRRTQASSSAWASPRSSACAKPTAARRARRPATRPLQRSWRWTRAGSTRRRSRTSSRTRRACPARGISAFPSSAYTR